MYMGNVHHRLKGGKHTSQTVSKKNIVEADKKNQLHTCISRVLKVRFLSESAVTPALTFFAYTKCYPFMK